MFQVCYLNSVTHTAGICINRLYMIKCKQNIIQTRKDLAFVIISCFILSIILTTIGGSGFSNCDNNLTLDLCSFDSVVSNGFFLYTGVVFLTIEIIIILLYVFLVINLYKHYNKMKQLRLKCMPGPDKSKEWKLKSSFYKHELKTLTTLGVMLIIFVVLSTPLHVELTLSGMGVIRNNFRLSRKVVLTLATTNSMINPIVFCLRIPEVKSAIHEGCCRLMMKLHIHRKYAQSSSN